MKALLSLFLVATTLALAGSPGYETREVHDRNGIGKFYLGREIAHVMGHEGADWLERPERAAEEKPDVMVDLLGIKAGETVADVGAGSGYMSWRLAQKVGTNGVVYGTDIQQEMLDLLAENMRKRGTKNVKTVLGTITDSKLPTNTLDLVLMVDVYHELSHPYEMMSTIVASLKPGGRMVFVEYRAEDPNVPIKEVHKMSEAQVKKEAVVVGLEWLETKETLPWQHMIFFRKPLKP